MIGGSTSSPPTSPLCCARPRAMPPPPGASPPPTSPRVPPAPVAPWLCSAPASTPTASASLAAGGRTKCTATFTSKPSLSCLAWPRRCFAAAPSASCNPPFQPPPFLLPRRGPHPCLSLWHLWPVFRVHRPEHGNPGYCHARSARHQPSTAPFHAKKNITFNIIYILHTTTRTTRSLSACCKRDIPL